MVRADGLCGFGEQSMWHIFPSRNISCWTFSGFTKNSVGRLWISWKMAPEPVAVTGSCLASGRSMLLAFVI